MIECLILHLLSELQGVRLVVGAQTESSIQILLKERLFSTLDVLKNDRVNCLLVFQSDL